jgi:hypothetical protein
LAQYRDCIEGQQVQYDPGMPVNSGTHFSATIALASSRERASSRMPPMKSRRTPCWLSAPRRSQYKKITSAAKVN